MYNEQYMHDAYDRMVRSRYPTGFICKYLAEMRKKNYLGSYNQAHKHISINLELYPWYCKTEDMIISELTRVISHEVMHHLFHYFVKVEYKKHHFLIYKLGLTRLKKKCLCKRCREVIGDKE